MKTSCIRHYGPKKCNLSKVELYLLSEIVKVYFYLLLYIMRVYITVSSL